MKHTYDTDLVLHKLIIVSNLQQQKLSWTRRHVLKCVHVSDTDNNYRYKQKVSSSNLIWHVLCQRLVKRKKKKEYEKNLNVLNVF